MAIDTDFQPHPSPADRAGSSDRPGRPDRSAGPDRSDGSPRALVLRARLQQSGRTATVTLALAGACFLVLCVSLSLGKGDISVPEVVRALFSGDDTGTGYIVNHIRLPRTLVAVLTGAAFAISGAIFQTLVRNPLASPDMLGVTVGASAAAVIGIVLLDLSGHAVSAAAFAGALATAAVIYVLAWRGGVSGYRLVLTGIAMSAILTSVVSYCMTRADVYDARDALGWLTGSLNAKSWPALRTIGLSCAVLIPAALLANRRLTVLQMGDDLARALGVQVERSRLALIVIAAALAGAATAVVGPVPFVALVAGPIARRLTGNSGSALIPAALVGALVMLTSDLAGQHAVGSVSLPVGVVTAIVGAPYLLWLLAMGNRAGRGE